MPVIPVLGREVEVGGAIQGPSTPAYISSEIGLGYITQRPICVPHDLVTPMARYFCCAGHSSDLFPWDCIPTSSKSRGFFVPHFSEEGNGVAIVSRFQSQDLVLLPGPKGFFCS